MYTVEQGARIVRLTVSDTETIKFSNKFNVFGVKGDNILASLKNDFEGDGVYSTADGDGYTIIPHYKNTDTLYLSGSGDVVVTAGNTPADCSFPKVGKGGGGSGGDGTHYKGTTTTAITNGSTTNPITIDGESYTAVFGDVVVYNYTEFVFDGTTWSEFGRPFDTTPTSGSMNAVTSDGIYKRTPLGRGTGVRSACGGLDATSNGNYSIGYGKGVKADRHCMAAFGQFNVWTLGLLFAIGNGTANDARSNIIEANSTGFNVNGDIQRNGVGIDDYSTTERKIGKWIDGSDLYQRTFVVTTLVNKQFNDSILGTSGIDIKDVQGWIDWTYNGEPNRRTALDYYVNTGDCVSLHNAYTDINVKPYRVDTGFAINEAVITIKYTKTQAQSLSANMTPTVIEETTDIPDVEEDDMR